MSAPRSEKSWLRLRLNVTYPYHQFTREIGTITTTFTVGPFVLIVNNA